MQFFEDTATGKTWAYQDDVVVTVKGGTLSFATARGVPLKAPATLRPSVTPAPAMASAASPPPVTAA